MGRTPALNAIRLIVINNAAEDAAGERAYLSCPQKLPTRHASCHVQAEAVPSTIASLLQLYSQKFPAPSEHIHWKQLLNGRAQLTALWPSHGGGRTEHALPDEPGRRRQCLLLTDAQLQSFLVDAAHSPSLTASAAGRMDPLSGIDGDLDSPRLFDYRCSNHYGSLLGNDQSPSLILEIFAASSADGSTTNGDNSRTDLDLYDVDDDDSDDDEAYESLGFFGGDPDRISSSVFSETTTASAMSFQHEPSWEPRRSGTRSTTSDPLLGTCTDQASIGVHCEDDAVPADEADALCDSEFSPGSMPLTKRLPQLHPLASIGCTSASPREPTDLEHPSFKSQVPSGTPLARARSVCVSATNSDTTASGISSARKLQFGARVNQSVRRFASSGTAGLQSFSARVVRSPAAASNRIRTWLQAPEVLSLLRTGLYTPQYIRRQFNELSGSLTSSLRSGFSLEF